MAATELIANSGRSMTVADSRDAAKVTSLPMKTQTRGIHTVKNRTTRHLNIDESLYPPALKQPRHTHQFASFSFVSSGSYLEDVGKKTYSRQCSTVILHPPNDSHAVEFESNVRILRVAKQPMNQLLQVIVC